MTDHSQNERVSRAVLWPDAQVESILVDYDKLSLSITESTGTRRTIVAQRYIGYTMVGFWDETIVERAELVQHDQFIDDCVKSIERRLGPEWGESGNLTRNRRSWSALIVHLGDGSTLRVVAVDFEVI